MNAILEERWAAKGGEIEDYFTAPDAEATKAETDAAWAEADLMDAQQQDADEQAWLTEIAAAPAERLAVSAMYNPVWMDNDELDARFTIINEALKRLTPEALEVQGEDGTTFCQVLLREWFEYVQAHLMEFSDEVRAAFLAAMFAA